MGAEQFINSERLVQTFLGLVQIDSLSGEEEAISMELEKRLLALGCESVQRDAAYNTYGVFPGNNGGDRVLLCAHEDTVGQEYGIRPIVENGVIHTDGSTILGADDKSGLAIILEILAVLKEHPEIPHPEYEIVFSASEETGMTGSKALDKGLLKAKWGLILDNGGPVGTISTSGPSCISYRFTIHGRASHAAAYPEKGINAIKAAALGIAECPVGNPEPGIVIGIGVIHGGIATNVTPDLVTVDAMIRSADEAKLAKWSAVMEECFDKGCAALGATLEISKDLNYQGYILDDESIPVRRMREACEKLGYALQTKQPLGGTDCNTFNACGIPCCPVSTGMANGHMKSEYIAIEDMVRCAQLIFTAVCA